LVETAFILQYTEQKSKEDVINDDVLCRAFVRSLEIIGEASKKLDDEFKTANNHIEWKKWLEQEIN
jgi:uncharacterized protein with HEPN domain